MTNDRATERIGILGGTFDPVHYGHLLIAESCREQVRLDKVLFLPAGDPPHKPGHPITAGRHRVEMLRLALSGIPQFQIDERELHRSGQSFTVLTLEELTAERPDAHLHFLMGADSLRDFQTWRTPDRIAELATLCVCNRPGDAPLAREQIEEWVGPQIADRVICIDIPGVAISASDLRGRVRTRRSLRFLTPKAVDVFIHEQGLYGPDGD